MKPITQNSPGVTITLEARPCDLPLEGNASAIDPETDAEIIRMIREELDAGNVWAWCEVYVTVRYRDVLSHTAALGGCSYKSEKDFRHDNGYFGDLVAECIDAINAQLVKLSDDKEGA